MTKRISDAGAALIKNCEALKLKAYLCPAKVWTIGWGHTGPDVYEGQVITIEEAEVLFRRDVGRFERCVDEFCPSTTQSQFDAMVSLCFNIGEGYRGKKRPRDSDGFRQSSVARLHNEGNFPAAQQAFALWNKAGGKLINGLVTRRAREADLYDNDDLPTDVEDMPQAVEGEKPLSLSKKVIGQTLTLGGTGAGLVIDQASTNRFSLTEYENVAHQLMPYFDQAKWLLLGIVIGGVVLSLYGIVKDRLEGRA